VTLYIGGMHMHVCCALLLITKPVGRKIFPNSSPDIILASVKGSALQRIKQKWAEFKVNAAVMAAGASGSSSEA